MYHEAANGGAAADEHAEEVLEQMQARFENLMRDKKTKESIVKREKQQKLAKAKQLGNNAPLAKYYRE